MTAKGTYTLHYFDANGRGECIRRMFRIKGVDFIDDRTNHVDWLSKKSDPKLAFSQLPVLELPNGKTLSQSLAIISYLARELGLDAESSLDKAYCDELVNGVNDIFAKCLTVKYAATEEAKAAAFKNVKNQVFPFYVSVFEKLYSRNEGPFLIGKKLTYADIYLTTFLDTHKDYCEEEFAIPETCKHIINLRAEIKKHFPSKKL